MQPYVLGGGLFLKALLACIKGVAIGAANIMPGVSGATLALVFGIYEKLVASVNELFKSPKSSLKFLAPLGIGMAAGIVLFGSLVDAALTSFPLESRLFISGLMLGSLPQVHNVALEVKAPAAKSKYYAVAVFSAALVAALVLFAPAPELALDAELSIGFLAYVFAGGVFAAAALMIPGISGAMVFILFGLYPLIMNVISQIREYVLSPTSFELLGPIFTVAAPLGVGIVVGVLLCSRLIAWLLHKRRLLTYFIIIGLIVGSVVALFASWPDARDLLWRPVLVLFGTLSFAAGFAASVFIGSVRQQG